MYKLIVSDYDGTLAGRDHIISPKVTSTIKSWISKGNGFSIASGRGYIMIKDEVKNLGLTTPQIVRGGAEIVDPTTDTVIYSQLMDKETVADFIHFLKENDYEVVVEDGDIFYSTNDYRSGYPIKQLSLDQFQVKAIPKFFIPIGNKVFEDAEKFLEEKLIKRYPQLHIVRSYSPMGRAWDVTSASATKHLAVLELLKILNMKREEVVGVGDGYNDFPLLEACGFKVAMGNAQEDLKAIADLVVPSYQEDGVAVLIEKLLAEDIQ